MTQVVSLSFFRFDSMAARIWAFAMMGLARRAMSRVPEIGFWKLCGSGTGEGFTPIPNTSVYAILATWPDEKTARKQTQSERTFARYRTKSVENWTVYMSAGSVRGEWAGQTPFLVSKLANNGPLAVLTRATIRPSILMRFWKRVPDISRVIGNDPNVAFKVGIGEVPWLHQVTFSIWPDATKMANFARTGHHAEAIKSVREEGWFSEELYARFHVLSDQGTWNGGSPLKVLETV
ncbi:spheroidene monooxygenase [uncultured Litoreibacter sp.]|uniref:spheroidene monooxygenase n=1 Tax=uncultured Litoreibacter sp. TaxID=1392394 RepID=UPI00260606BE|nr:spheroidene monooxygenase [uncultured Litoreibacter sp.]